MGKVKKITEQDLKLARRIQKVRKQRGITQEKLADKLGVSATFIGYVEIGYRKPNLKMVYKIARALNVKVKDIFPF